MSKDSKDKSIHINPVKKKDSVEEHSSLEMRYLRSRLPNCDEGFFIDALALEDGNPFAAFKIIEEKDAIKVFGITSPENLNRFSSQERKHLEKWRAEYIKQETIQKERALSASSNAVHSGSSLSLNNQQKNNSK